MRATLEPGFVLHRRAYRETSFLVDIYTLNHGRLTVMARGVRKARSPAQALLQPFTPLLISWGGNGELKMLVQVESHGEAKHLQGDCLFAGFYINELLICLTQKWDANPQLFSLYENTLGALQNIPLNLSVLRLFEKKFLEELGYGVLSKSMSERHNSFLPEKYYRFMPESGFELMDNPSCHESVGWQPGDINNTVGKIGMPVHAFMTTYFSGQSLLDYIEEKWLTESSLQDAKRLNRMRIAVLLAGKKLHSRALFTGVK